MFDSILGLPLHPLLVHAPVVLLPLVAAGLIALVLKPAWRPRYAGLALVVLTIAAVGTLGAVLSGLALAERVGLPEQHRLFGISTAVAAGTLLVVGGLWLWRVRRETEPAPPAALGWVVAVVSAIVIVLAVLTGHSGATATWGDTIEGVAQPVVPAATPSDTGDPTPAPTNHASNSPTATGTGSATPSVEVSSSGGDGSPAAITMADVAANNSAESCWAVVNGTVYDLTEWISQHPGGADRILALCGTDATAAFTGQHQGDETPETTLQRFALGPVA